MKTFIVFLSLSLLLQSCATYDSLQDPVYLNHLEFTRNMNQAVARGEITRVQADATIYQSYSHYLDYRQRQKQQIKAEINQAIEEFDRDQQLAVQKRQLQTQQLRNQYLLANQTGNAVCVTADGYTSVC